MDLRFTVFALLCAGLVRAADVTESFSETHPLEGNAAVRVSNVNGSITISTWDRPEAAIEGEKRAESAEDLAKIVVEIRAEPRSLVVRATFPDEETGWWGRLRRLWHHGNESVSFVLHVPASARLESIADVNGAVTITGARG